MLYNSEADSQEEDYDITLINEQILLRIVKFCPPEKDVKFFQIMIIEDRCQELKKVRFSLRKVNFFPFWVNIFSGKSKQNPYGIGAIFLKSRYQDC